MAVPSHERVDWRLPVFGLTGSIASGKSVLGRAFSALGAEVIDADRLGHRLLWKGRPAYRRVVEAFGRGVLGGRGGIDRARLGSQVFRDRKARRVLEEILHPAILGAARRRIENLARERFAVVLFEAALLVESGFDAQMHDTIVVVCRRELMVERLVRIRGLDRDEAARRIRAQWSGERKAAHARWIVRNDTTIQDLERRAGPLYRKLLSHPRTRALRRGFSARTR